ncbi:MAG: class I SAM-dependent methyltransferase [Candidatus Aureabacteria bacterium]|nr:class I SAM-dependent methyltransferase [Candidatus Auribacterota bacterium]
MKNKVWKYFDSGAGAFDSIYTGKKGWLGILLDRIFRKDMRERFEETMRECRNVRGTPILDVGCGSGRYAIELARRGAQVTGVDVSGEMLTIARTIARENGLIDRCTFLEGDFQSLKLERPFSVTLAIGLFDYIPSPVSPLGKMRELTEGKLIATFPRLWTWRAPLRKARLALRGCPVYFYRRKRIGDLLRESGWGRWSVKKVGKLHFVVAHSSPGQG